MYQITRGYLCYSAAFDAAQVCTEPMAPLRLFAADGHALAATVTRSSMTSQPGGLESGVPRGPSSVVFSHVFLR